MSPLCSVGELLRLELKAKKTHSSCGRFEANISGIDAEAFPDAWSVGGTSADQPPVVFRRRQAEAVPRLIEGQSSDFNRIIARESKTRVTLRTAGFLRATKAA
jgi:DNA polymerase III sliding clamp (beta) subunit (PCNA family)